MVKKVLLTGAGFAQAFCGPSTNELTHAFFDDASLQLNPEINGHCCFSHLVKEILDSESTEKPNFEHFFCFLDEMVVAGRLLAEQKTLSPDLYLLKDLIENPRIHNSMKKNWNPPIQINLPGKKWSFEDDKNNYYYIPLWIRCYFEALVKQKIFEYDINHEQPIELIVKMAQHIHSSHTENKALYRCYTLNYDYILNRHLKTSLGKKSKTIEENPFKDGFTNPIHFGPGSNVTYAGFDAQSVKKYADIPQCYNLHGSAYWAYENLGYQGIVQPLLYRRNHLGLEPQQWGKNHTVVYPDGIERQPFALISGRKKPLYIQNVAPYDSYFKAFQKDLMEASEIISIGYGFADEHINALLFDALCTGTPITLHLVDIKEPKDFLQSFFEEKKGFGTKLCSLLQIAASQSHIAPYPEKEGEKFTIQLGHVLVKYYGCGTKEFILQYFKGHS